MEELDTPVTQSSSPQPRPTAVNPLMSRIKMPGETFTLPSGGAFYVGGELDPSVKNAEVHIHPMTAIDEIIIKTPDLLFSGDAVRQVFAHCIPQIQNVDDLLAKDVDFLLLCLRKVSYGDELRLEHKHNCVDSKSHTYSVDVTHFIRTAKRIDPTSVASKFSVRMPNDQVVHLQPIRFKDFVRIMQMNDTESITDPKVIRDIMVESMSNIITNVDEVSDKEMIKEWLAGVPPLYFKKINEHIDQTLEWGPEFETTVKCKDCGADMEILAPMNPLYFFT